MFSRAWRIVTAFGGLTLAALAYAQPVDSDSRRNEAASQSAEQPSDSRDKTPTLTFKDLLGRIASALEAEVDKPESAEEAARANRDLAAQEVMAKWAKWMAWAGGAEIALTLLGIFLIWRTLVHTRNAAQAARASAEWAEAATEVSREAMIADQRAWVASELFIAEGLGEGMHINETGISLLVRARNKNVGKTPAIRVYTSMDMFLFSVEGEDYIERFAKSHRVSNTKSSRLALPNQEYDRAWGLSLQLPDGLSPGRFVSPTIVVCVTYELSNEPGVHQTVCVYDVGLGSGTTWRDMIPVGSAQTIRKRDLIISAAAGGFAD